LINSLLGQEVAKAGTGNRTTVSVGKYGGRKLPGVRLIFLDSMGIETKNTEGSLDASIGHGERRLRRLDPARQAPAGIACFNKASDKYEDIDGDLVAFFRGRNIPVIVVLTRSEDRGWSHVAWL
jgi:hypothetical protein